MEIKRPEDFRPRSCRTVGLDDLEAELLAFDDRAEAGALHSRNVDENVGAAVVGLNKAEAFGRVEELNCSSDQDHFLIAHRKYVRQALRMANVSRFC